ncbi:hypothetical protein NP590_05175 [Methylomonas sp. SURF-2]|uniref:Outer-membrane lipoprotein LolB n=1 Tax=Methylomonas subterranea TaxID=2952225 RepID=A0ABT1TDG5_9GAMM|nr:hypothetical protein [Methylomonas sp. SURF-2]MCQ8103491.1 hypothetical protein [Methylomonas sp. SURF-2]
MSNRSRQILIHLIVAALGLTLTACGTPSAQRKANVNIIDPAVANPPALAAEFVTTRAGEEHRHESPHEEQQAAPETVEWRIWRDSRQIVTERPRLGIGELWQLDGQTIIHRKLYHADRRAIEFQHDDLKMLQSAPSWQKLSLMLDPQLLRQLSAGDIEWVDGYPVREYSGQLEGTDWRVVMRMDIALPSIIERRHGEFFERTELLASYPLSQSPWRPTSADAYEIIDFADLGDKETDPFVIKVQAQMGHEHHH